MIELGVLLFLFAIVAGICHVLGLMGDPKPQCYCGYYVNRSCSHIDGPYCTIEHCKTLSDIVKRKQEAESE